MQVEFKKIPSNGIPFETELSDIKFSGDVQKISKSLVKCIGSIQGTFYHACDRCAEDFKLSINECVEVFVSDGLYADAEGEELLNVIEFFDGSIDFGIILQSELEAFKSDYHFCGQCEQLKGE